LTPPLEVSTQPSRLKEVIELFLRLGVTAYGGPAAHIAMMRDEVVERRKWMSEQHFLDMLGATNLIPGPNSTEMAIHTGYARAGFAGLVAAGVCFIIPAFLIVLAFAWAYVEFNILPATGWLLYGVKPVVIAIILQALWALGKKAIKGPLTIVAGGVTLALYFFNINNLLLLIGAGLVVMLGQNWQRLRPNAAVTGLLPLPALILPALNSEPFNLTRLFWVFLKIGAVLYGSGYVLLAFLQADLVTNLGWLTEQQLLDAVAVGQVTPGPVFTTATFIGYILGGVPGAIAATVGIFLPSFIFVAISNPIIPRIRNSLWASALLDGVNAASLGLMAAVTWQLGVASLVDPLTITLAIISAVLLFRFKVNSTWLILGGAIAGVGAHSAIGK
jgi:chromate transporter